jgi:hypothetical protein
MKRQMNNNTSSTILTISMGFLLIHIITNWQWAIFTSISIGFAGLVSNYMSDKIERVWLKLAKILSYIVPNILLSLIFYFFLTPLAFLYRLFNKDVLKLSNKYESYFNNVNEIMDKDSFHKTW